MPLKLAFVDYDGPLADCEPRLATALDVYCACVPDWAAHLRTEDAARESSLYWATVFRPDLVLSDPVVAGAASALTMLERRGWTIIVHTSRPDSILPASLNWLEEHGLWGPGRELITKPAEARIGTPLLKAIQAHARVGVGIASTGVDEILFVDDSEANRKEVLKYLPGCRVAADLKAAMALLTE